MSGSFRADSPSPIFHPSVVATFVTAAAAAAVTGGMGNPCVTLGFNVCSTVFGACFGAFFNTCLGVNIGFGIAVESTPFRSNDDGTDFAGVGEADVAAGSAETVDAAGSAETVGVAGSAETPDEAGTTETTDVAGTTETTDVADGTDVAGGGVTSTGVSVSGGGGPTGRRIGGWRDNLFRFDICRQRERARRAVR